MSHSKCLHFLLPIDINIRKKNSFLIIISVPTRPVILYSPVIFDSTYFCDSPVIPNSPIIFDNPDLRDNTVSLGIPDIPVICVINGLFL